MTSPMAMPYTLTFSPTATTFMYPDANVRGTWTGNYYQHRFTQGSYTAHVKYFSTGRALRARVGGVTLAELVGSGWLSKFIEFSVPQGGEKFLQLSSLTSFTQAEIDAGVTASVTVYPTPLFTP